MKTSPQRYVAHLDILGMRELTRQNHHEAWSTLSALVVALHESIGITIISDKVDGPIHVPESIRSVMFSDTIVLYSAADSARDFHAMFTAVVSLFSKALHYSVPIRVGISKGIFYAEEKMSMYAGPALIEAHDLGEASQWLGIVLSKSVAEDAIKQDLRSGSTHMVIDWDVPTKNGAIHAFVANWPVALKSSFRTKPPLTSEMLYSVFEKYFGPFEELPESVLSKYVNTVRFINEQYALHEQT
jgi:hypothetical protein